MQIARILVTSPVEKAFDYLVPEHMMLGLGDYVTVPFGPRELVGVVWELPDLGDIPSAKMKAVLSKHDIPPMAAQMRGFIDWVAHYNMAPRGAILKMAVSVDEAMTPPPAITGYIIGTSHLAKSGDVSIQKALAFLQERNRPIRASEITDKTGLSAARIKTLTKQGVLSRVDVPVNYPCTTPDPETVQHVLTPEQHQASSALLARINTGGYETFLLDGVTGSGKTEVYFEAIAELIRRDQQVVILMPEIALTTSFIERFQARFGVRPALWHSSLTAAQRRITWRGVAFGQTKVVVGARSSLFLPYKNLGLIIVDEEHDPSFKQEEVVIYNARDMAVVRAHQTKIPVVLVSATPSLETLQNGWDQRYTLLSLPARYGGASKPDIRLIDLTKDKPERQHFLSPILRNAIQHTLDSKEQVMLFLNRRGFAPLTICRACGHRLECPKCTSWLVEHRAQRRLQCHHCGYHAKIPTECPSCHEQDSLVACGPGVERIAEEIGEYFPDARSLILASDITDTHDKLLAALDQIRSGEIDIIIGTQIIAKGHHFPKITCVGIVDADLGLSGGDLRASERSFQLLHQVAGRAGREQLKGTVYLQTFNPQQKVMQMLAADNRDKFMELEAAERVRAHMPPAARLAALIFTGLNEIQTKDVAHMVGRLAPRMDGIRILGPAPAQMYRIRGKYRFRILIQADRDVDIQKLIATWLNPIKIPSAVRVTIDIDPINFL